jgi:integrase
VCRRTGVAALTHTWAVRLRTGSPPPNLLDELPYRVPHRNTTFIAESLEVPKQLLRAGETLLLTVDDLDFNDKTVRVNKSIDDATREVRQPKTPSSVALLPMPTPLEGKLRDYLQSHWTPNSKQLLFPNRKGMRPRSRDNVVRVGLKPVLKKLGMPGNHVGLHAFRHGPATELAEASVPITVLQNQLRHADVKTTLRVYSDIIPQTQREVMEPVG